MDFFNEKTVKTYKCNRLPAFDLAAAQFVDVIGCRAAALSAHIFCGPGLAGIIMQNTSLTTGLLAVSLCFVHSRFSDAAMGKGT
jgi:hypothetical protein